MVAQRALAFLLMMISMEVQSQTSDGTYSRDRQADRPTRPERVSRARERCKADRGVDCDTAKGLREWELLDRSRREAVQDGSRHLVSPQRR